MISITTLMFYFVFEIMSLICMYVYQLKCIKSKKKGSSNTQVNNIYKKKFVIKKSSICLLLSFMPLLILIGFRNISVGVDTLNYINTFYRIVSGKILLSDKEWLSFGFIFIIKIIGLISKNYVFYNIVIGFLTLFFIYKSIIDISTNPVFSLYIFISTCLFYQTFNQSRQMLAIAIVLYSYKYIINNNFKRFLFYAILAFSIHKSAIIILPFYFFTNSKINKKNISKYCLLGISCYLFFPLLKMILLLTYYGVTYQRNGFFITTQSSIINLIFRILLIAVCIYFYKKYCNKENKTNIKLINFGMWCIVFQVLATKIYIISRITTYFFVSFILLIPNIYSEISRPKSKKLFLIGMVVLFITYHIMYFKLVGQDSGYNLYRFFFS